MPGPRIGRLGAVLFLLGSCDGTRIDRFLPPAGTDASTPEDDPVFPDDGYGEDTKAFIEVGAIAFVNDSESGPAGGVAFLDADGDGRQDLFLTAEIGESRLYRNLGSWAFADSTEELGLSGLSGALGAAAADLDGDGDDDLVVGAIDGLRILWNEGGGFTQAVLPLGAPGVDVMCPSIAPGDVDGDGLYDLYIGCWAMMRGRLNALLVQGPPGTFTDVATEVGVAGEGATLAVALSDHDDDGDLDLFEVNDFGMAVRGNELYRSSSEPGAPRFTRVSDETGFYAEIYGMGIAPIDFDGDLDLDYYVTNVFYNLLLENDQGVFTDVAREVGAGVYGFLDRTQIFYSFRAPQPGEDQTRMEEYLDSYTEPDSRLLGLTSFAPVVFDYDQDGAEDILVVNGFVGLIPQMPEGQRQPSVLLHARGDGTFEEAPNAPAGDKRTDGRGGAHGDLDGDGDQDVVIVGNGFVAEERGRARLFRNDVASGGFLRVRPRRRGGSTDALGARVTIEVAGRSQVREIGCSGFASSSERVAHFGVGRATRIDRVEVRFASGAVVELRDLHPGDEVDVVEP